MYDVSIIGAGVVGCAIARELAKYDIKVCVVEKDGDVSNGTSKANSGIVHGGYDSAPNTLKAKLCVKGNEMFKQLDNELKFGFKKCGSYVLGFDENDHKEILKLYEKGTENKVRNISVVEKEFILANEPNVNPDVHSALFCGSAGIISPFEFTIALAENAADNGVEFILETPVTGIEKTEEGYKIKSNDKEILTKYVINSAGLFSDKIAKMAGMNNFEITPRKGEYLLFDKEIGSMAKSVLFQTPKEGSKGILVTPTIHGNLMVGPNATYVDDKEDLDTTKSGLAEVGENAKKTMPELDMSKIITQYAGLRSSMESYDFIIEETEKGFVNLIGIDSPGLTSSPAIALYVKDILLDSGMELKEKVNFISHRTPYIRMDRMSNEEINELIEQDKSFGKIVCRCESISEGEILDVLRRSIPVNSVDGIKRRARVTSGRCQGGFCTPRVMEIMSRELKMDMLDINKGNKGSYILADKTKTPKGGKM
ncbi:NAD(P)/FAD-dependent oxidoreductase [Alkalibacter mobilis]|uniref:NAD(P)/FAD-dependent oxidoreductase n=1 Tax=Alkalibacter mobilis TaxID=2787712 RepID=UPI00189D7F03|nr:NAD(P)/FAD-dependent oxidoreductase [Alkalibacter mobilis]MBF7096351.1 FAD-dependent oxidoreductase [Alkalibacter mobilis]